MATPTLIQSVTNSATSTSVGANITPTAGNTLIVYGFAGSGTANLTVSDNVNTGSYHQDAPSATAASNAIVICSYIGVAGSATTVTLVSTVSTSVRILVQEWSGIDGVIPYDQSTAIINGTSAAPACRATGNLLQNGELVVGWFRSTTATTWTAGSGFTLDTTLQSLAAMAEYTIASSTSPVTANITTSGSVTWLCMSAAYRPSQTRKVIAITSGTTFSAPSDWPGIADKAELIGGGGAGRSGSNSTDEGCGGGGGAYTFQNNYTLPNGTAIQIGQGGTTNGANGTGTWIVANNSFFADFGRGAALANPGVGGAAANCIPSANANSGGSGGGHITGATCGATGGGGAAGPYGGAGAGGTQNVTGTTGGTGGGGGGCPTPNSAVNQTASNQAGTAGGNYGGSGGAIANTGGTGGASGDNNGNAGNGLTSPTTTCGSGGGGGGSDAAGGGGGGGNGGAGGEWGANILILPGNITGQPVGSGGGGGGTGQITSGSTPVPGNGGLYGGGGGGGGGKGTFSAFGTGAQGVIVLTYTPLPPASTALLPFSSTQFFVQDQVVVS